MGGHVPARVTFFLWCVVEGKIPMVETKSFSCSMGALELSSLLVYGGLGSPSWHGRVSTRLARDQARKYKEKGDLEFDSSLFDEAHLP